MVQWLRRGRGFDSWLGTKIPQATGQLSSCAATAEPVGPGAGATTRESVSHNKRSSMTQDPMY